MKRTKKIIADGYAANVTVTINIRSRPGYLVRSEVEAMTDAIADATMTTLNGARYLNVPLSQIKVR